MPPQKSSKQDIPPGTFSQIRPGTNVIPLTPEENEALNRIAMQQGTTKAEAIRQMAEMIPKIPQAKEKKSIVNDTIGTIERARDLGIVDDDKKSPINMAMQYGLFKDLRRDMKKGDEDRMTTREIMEMNVVNMQMLIMQKTVAGGDNPQSQRYDQVISELKAENEKSRQFYEQRLKEQDEKFKELLLDKRIREIEDSQEKTLQLLSQQIADIDNKIKAYQNIPMVPTPEQKKDAISHLEQLGNDLERIKKALSPFGLTQQGQGTALAAPGATGNMYKNPDGSMNMTLYGIDKATEVAGRLLDAWSRKAPEPRQVQESQLLTGAGGEQASPPKKQMTYQEFYEYLINKGDLTPDEVAWKKGYEEYLTKLQSDRINMEHQAQQQIQELTAEQAKYDQEQNTEPGQEPITDQQTPKKGLIERLQQFESEKSNFTL